MGPLLPSPLSRRRSFTRSSWRSFQLCSRALVPKLCLGTHLSWKLLFPFLPGSATGRAPSPPPKQSFGSNCVPKQSLGTSGESNCAYELRLSCRDHAELY